MSPKTPVAYRADSLCCQLANTFAEFLAHYLAMPKALARNGFLAIRHTQSWQKMTKSSSTQARILQSS
ncbi:MAG: hypothetical protein C0473_01600 [Cyanobacteria bacterium DS3.002]|nr:hypothetical protein [Cyanobacteria bacterium DS3.002]MBA4049560.1 hypothetical protein [Cyanobacteria bacterium DS2.008]